MCLTCLHPTRENNTTRPYLNQHLAFAYLLIQEPAIVERRGRPAGSTVGFMGRVGGSTGRVGSST